jgi:hypothetical protein
MTVGMKASRSLITVKTVPNIIKLGKNISSSPVRPLDNSGLKMNCCFSVNEIVSSKSLSTMFSLNFHSLHNKRKYYFNYYLLFRQFIRHEYILEYIRSNFLNIWSVAICELNGIRYIEDVHFKREWERNFLK